MPNLKPTLVALLLGSAAAQTASVSIPGTSASYWLFHDPHTMQNISAVIMTARNNPRAALTMKCLGGGNMRFLITSPVAFIADGYAVPTNGDINTLYTVSYAVGKARPVKVTRLEVLNYFPTNTNTLGLDEDSSLKLWLALIDGEENVQITVAPGPRNTGVSRDTTYTFSTAGFDEAVDAINACDMG